MAYWYHQGTITVTQDSTTVSGTGTAFVENLRVGDGLLAPDGRLYLIQNIASDAELAIARGYVGETAADSADWWGVPVQGYNRDLADRVQNLVTEAGEALEVVGQAKDWRDQAQGFSESSEEAATTSGQNAQATGEDRAGVAQSVQQVQGLVQDAEELRDETSDLRGQTEQLATAAGQAEQGAGEARDQAQQIADCMTALPETTAADSGKSVVVNAAGDGLVLAAVAGKMVGESFPLWDHLPGVEPPDNSGSAKYIRLTAGESGAGDYNEGLLTNESVTGSGPLLVATAQIASGPLSGQTVHLVNTMAAHITPGISGNYHPDQMQRITGEVSFAAQRTTNSGAFSSGSSQNRLTGPQEGTTGAAYFDSADSPGARTGDHTNTKRVEATYYMRVV